MGSEQPAEFYDARLDKFLVPYEDCDWKDLYDAAVALMPADRNVRIVDAGCGTGRLAEALRRSGYENYLGFDFSPVRIAEARRYLPRHDFKVMDAFSDDAVKVLASADVVVITEVLEHIERDRGLLASIPAGTLIVFSVPDFDATAHVRKFATVEEVLARFSDLIDLDASRITTIAKNSKKAKSTKQLIFLGHGRKRP